MSYRVGLIGTGGIARAHGKACQQVDRAELVAVCDISKDAMANFGERFGVEAQYLDLDEMLAKENLDIVVICNWGAYHAKTGIQAARSGQVKAVLCEKPFTINAAEAETFAQAGRESGVLVAEAFKFRYHPMHIKAKELVTSGAIGELIQVRSTFCTGVPLENRRPEKNWRWNKEQGGGSIFDLACYNIHYARFMFGAEPERIFAVELPGVEVDDASTIVMDFGGGRTAQISVAFNAWRSQYAEVIGDQGMLRMDKAWNNEDQLVAIEQETGDGKEVIEFEPVFQFALQLEHLCDCLETGAPHRIPLEDSVAQMRAIDAIYESMATGKSVELVGGAK